MTLTQQLQNPSITTDCDASLTIGRSYCVEAYNEPEPGETTSTPLVTTTPTTLPTTTPSVPPTTTTKPSNGIETPSPSQPNIVDDCDAFYLVQPDEGCDAIASKHGITVDQFTQWNRGVGNTCSGLWANAYACVSVIGHTPTPTSPGNGISTPSPAQPSMVSNCDAFYFVKAGDSCDSIASKHGITPAQFKDWNRGAGSSCTGLWADAYACVSVIGHTPTPTNPGNGITTPTPAQPSMVSNCDAFYLVKSGDTCDSIASQHGITAAQFRDWNRGAGSSCTGLWANAYACVSIIGHNPTPTQPGNGISTPTPIQSGMTKNCKTFHLVRSGESCATIQSRYKVTLAQLVSWNPAIGSQCTGMWSNTYLCVGVL